MRDHLHPAHNPDDESDEYDCPEDAADIHSNLLQEAILIEADPSQPVGALPYTAGLIEHHRGVTVKSSTDLGIGCSPLHYGKLPDRLSR